MLEVVICLVIHCVISFLFKYCYDKEMIWQDSEEPPRLHMPKLYDLGENCSVYDQQKYVDEVICPSVTYFSKVSDINEMQKDYEPVAKFTIWLSTFFLTGNAFRRAQITPYTWLNISFGVLACIITMLIISAIYKRTKLKLGAFKRSTSDLKREFYYIKENCSMDFDISEDDALNNFVIENHRNYISCVYYTIAKRYRARKTLEAIAIAIYALFIMRVPD